MFACVPLCTCLRICVMCDMGVMCDISVFVYILTIFLKYTELKMCVNVWCPFITQLLYVIATRPSGLIRACSVMFCAIQGAAFESRRTLSFNTRLVRHWVTIYINITICCNSLWYSYRADIIGVPRGWLGCSNTLFWVKKRTSPVSEPPPPRDVLRLARNHDLDAI